MSAFGSASLTLSALQPLSAMLDGALGISLRRRIITAYGLISLSLRHSPTAGDTPILPIFAPRQHRDICRHQAAILAVASPPRPPDARAGAIASLAA